VRQDIETSFPLFKKLILFNKKKAAITRAKVAAQPPDVRRLTTWGTLKSALQLNATLQLNASCGLASNFMTHNTFVTQHNLVTK